MLHSHVIFHDYGLFRNGNALVYVTEASNKNRWCVSIKCTLTHGKQTKTHVVAMMMPVRKKTKKRKRER